MFDKLNTDRAFVIWNSHKTRKARKVKCKLLPCLVINRCTCANTDIYYILDQYGTKNRHLDCLYVPIFIWHPFPLISIDKGASRPWGWAFPVGKQGESTLEANNTIFSSIYSQTDGRHRGSPAQWGGKSAHEITRLVCKWILHMTSKMHQYMVHFEIQFLRMNPIIVLMVTVNHHDKYLYTIV